MCYNGKSNKTRQLYIKYWANSIIPFTSTVSSPHISPQTLETSTPSFTNIPVYNSDHFPIEHFDVDYLNPRYNSVYITHNSSSQSHSQDSYNIAMETASTASASPKGVINTSDGAYYTYNNNLLYCAPSTITADSITTTVASHQTSYHSPLVGIPIAALTPSPVSSNLSTPTEATEHFGIAHENDVDAAAVNELSQRLQAELRAAKSRHLSCTEVSLPWDLTPRIAADMIKTSEREPCGVRGCAIYIDFEDETGSARRIASFKVDPNTVSTFELFLTLKQHKSGWTSLLPQFLKNLTRSSTILISPHFTLNKHKLYAYSEYTYKKKFVHTYSCFFTKMTEE